MNSLNCFHFTDETIVLFRFRYNIRICSCCPWNHGIQITSMLLATKSKLHFWYFANKIFINRVNIFQFQTFLTALFLIEISGYVLVTVFSLLNCCGLLVLLGLNPYPGTPFHDVTTGVILALSSLIVLIISLGVITSKWCIAPPPDNRVDVC